jgi:spore maturation protein CgeB
VGIVDTDKDRRLVTRGSEKIRKWMGYLAVVKRMNLAMGRPLTRMRECLKARAMQVRRQAVRAKILERAIDWRPDLVFVINGLDLDPNILEEIRRKTGARICFYHTEDFLCLPELHPKSFVEALPVYDCVFTPTAVNVREYREYGVQRAEYLPYGFDPIDHQPSKLIRGECERFAAELAFVGKWWYERAEILERLIDTCRVAIWGPGWELLKWKSPLRPYVKWEIVLGPEMAKVYSASKLCLNHMSKRPNRQWHVMRTFEIPACGGFQLSERSEETLTFFTEGKEIECYGSVDEARGKIRYYLNHESERCRIARNGYSRCTTSRHSYSDRADRVLSIVE